MLDIITDFWKPVKKQTAPETQKLEGLQIGSTIGFGFVPQTNLSGRQFEVASINTYQFGAERLTSYVLEQEGDYLLSLIVGEAEGEKYLALSRRVPAAERAALIDANDLSEAIEKSDIQRLNLREGESAWKYWVVTRYKKDIHKLPGKLLRGDYRSFNTVPESAGEQAFDYYLFTSDNNEYAIEIEKYPGGEMSMFATIFRRTTDIADVTHPGSSAEITQLNTPVNARESSSGALTDVTPEPANDDTVDTTSEDKAESSITAAASAAPPSSAASLEKEKGKEERLKEEGPAILSAPVTAPAAPASIPSITPASIKETTPMPNFNNPFAGKTESMNGSSAAHTESKPSTLSAYSQQEVKAVSTRPAIEAENDAVQCELRVANKIIEEAIRNEMRMSDVVRRIIALPVAYQEAVQIPVTLSDEDFKLLAIRYGTSSGDREAIKRRIIEELNDFSGGKKQ